MGSVAYLHEDELVDMPEPVCARPGDIFEVVVFNDDVPLSFFPGAKVVVQINYQVENGLYVINDGGDFLAARLVFSDALNVAVNCLHPHFPSGKYRRDKIKIHGRVVELYPAGTLASRWILYCPGMVYLPSAYELPILLEKGPRR